MKQLVILSGKGGTGKTSLTAAFAHLAHAHSLPLVIADTDVDAANLELVLSPSVVETHNFIGGEAAMIDPLRCEGCGICQQVCRFEAISTQESIYQVDPIACEGCAACMYRCPVEAIKMIAQFAGTWSRSTSPYGALFHAALRPAQENSGKLVKLVKQQARLLALDEKVPLVLVDGPPGIGCPVISAVSGADLALIVTEPTAAGIHDMERALQMTRHFRVPALVCINKADIYPQGAQQIEVYCQKGNIEMVGKIPFDPMVTKAMVNGKPVTAYAAESPASRAMTDVWQSVKRHLSLSQGF